MSEEHDGRIRELERFADTHKTQVDAWWKEQWRLNDLFRGKHEGHLRHIKHLTTNVSELPTRVDMTSIEEKIVEVSKTTQTLVTDLAERRGAEKTWRTIIAGVGLVLVLIQIWRALN